MNGVGPETRGLMQASEPGSNFTRTFDEIRATLGTRSGWTRYWDEAAQAPYLYDAQNRSFLSYEDADSLRSKARYVLEHGLGGAMFWEYSNDRRAELLGVLHAALRR